MDDGSQGDGANVMNLVLMENDFSQIFAYGELLFGCPWQRVMIGRSYKFFLLHKKHTYRIITTILYLKLADHGRPLGTGNENCFVNTAIRFLSSVVRIRHWL